MDKQIEPKNTYKHKTTGKKVKVMAVADNYLMCRIPGCIPFVKYLPEFNREYE